MSTLRTETDRPISCVGLGWVGLFTTLSFCKEGHDVVGLDIDPSVVDSLNHGELHVDVGLSGADVEQYVDDGRLVATTDLDDRVAEADTYVVSVPTPIDEDDRPNVSYLREAATAIADVLSEGDLVVLQSTVYPGCSRDVLIPRLEQSGLTAGEDFGVSYVPERYTPGDSSTMHVPRVVGAVSEEWRAVTADLYESVCESVVPVSSLEAAEATKLIENVQRDVNIALMNEFDKIARSIGIDTHEVIEAAGTKWNFHEYRPGLGVGGHCIPVDPYYLITQAERKGAPTDVISTARDVNERMPEFYYGLLAEGLDEIGVEITACDVCILGVTYKPGVKDVRNSPALQMVELLESKVSSLRVYDPLFDPDEPIPGSTLTNAESVAEAASDANAVLVGTGHEAFPDGETVERNLADRSVILDPYEVVLDERTRVVESETIRREGTTEQTL